MTTVPDRNLSAHDQDHDSREDAMISPAKSDQRGPWLILSHAFNMDGRAASQTMTDKIPHLIANGITPIVLSAVTGLRDKIVEHHRLLPVAPSGLRFDLRHVFRRHIKNKIVYKIAVELMTLPLLPFYILERQLLNLEPQWSWFIPAYVKGACLIRKRGCTVIYTAGGANSAHFAGYLLAKTFPLTWIVELHKSMVFRNWTKIGMRQRFAIWLERKICERADVVIWSVDAALDRARQRHPGLGNRGKMMIPGADPPLFGKIAYARGRELVIGHFGSLALARNLAIFLEGLELILRKRPEFAKIVRIELYGGGIDAISAQAIGHFAFPQVIRNFGRLERDPTTGESGRDQVLKRMQTVDALMLLHGTDFYCEESIPSKLYEYLWTERPIIGLVTRNAQIERILREAGHWAVQAHDVSAVVAALEELVNRWEANDLCDSGKPSPYTIGAAVHQIIGWAKNADRTRMQ